MPWTCFSSEVPFLESKGIAGMISDRAVGLILRCNILNYELAVEYNSQGQKFFRGNTIVGSWTSDVLRIDGEVFGKEKAGRKGSTLWR